ncbi:MAG: two-component regulator propeller domain-containing protein [Bacteroidota bacterium]
MPQTFATSVARDSLGFLWFGTAGGLARYDGYQFDVFELDPDDPASLPDPVVRALLVARDGTLWVGMNSAGAARFLPSTQQFERIPVGVPDAAHLPNGQVNALHQSADGALWIGTADGLVRRDPATGALVHLRDGGRFSVTALADAEGGGLWVGMQNGRLYHVAPGTRVLRRQDLAGVEASGVSVVSLHDREGRLWMGTSDGLRAYNPGTGTAQAFDAALLQQPIETLFAEPNGWLWLSTPEGFVLFDTNTEQVITVRSNAPGNAINLPQAPALDVLYDSAGMFWIATAGSGVAYADFQTSPIGVYRSEPGALASPSLRSIASDSLAIWAGLNSQGLNRIDRVTGTVTRYPLPAPPPGVPWTNQDDATVYGLDFDRQGRLWSVVQWGVRRHTVSGAVAQTYLFPSAAYGIWRPAFVHEDQAGTLWVGGSVLATLDPVTGQFEESLPTIVRAVHEAADGVLWLASNDGLLRYDPRTGARASFRHDPADPASIPNDALQAVAAQGDSVLWLGSAAGVARFDVATGQATRYSRSNSLLPNNFVNGVLVDDTGYVWVSTNGGLARLDPATGAVTTLSATRGVQGREFNRGAYHKAADGTLMFGGIDGLNVFKPSRLRDNPYPPAVQLRRIVAGADVLVPGPGALAAMLDDGESLRLRSDQDVLSFEYVGLHYAAPEENRYQFILDGADADWQPLTASREARYTHLPPGSYAFRVRARSAYGVWSDDVTLARLVLPPPWWATWWFQLLLVAGVLGTIGALVQWRTTEARARARRLRIEVANRTSDLTREQAQTARQAEALEVANQQQRRLFANLSHETRTPLTLILSPVEDTLARDDLTDDLRAMLERVRQNGRRLLHLIDQILDLSRMEVGQTQVRLQRVDLGEFVAALAVAFEGHATRRGLVLSWGTPDERVVGDFDVALLEHILFNLTANAIKYTPEGGKVRVSLSVEDEGATAALRVRDTGIGIPPDQIDRIWERFALVDEGQASSTGIGLALVQEAVELLGGTVGVESRPGFGTTFTVRLPVQDAQLDGAPVGEAYVPQADLADAVPAQPPTVTGRLAGYAAADRTTVLVVEDAADVRAYLASLLRADYLVVEAADGEAGLAKARERTPDLVVSDVAMPRMDGLALAEALRADPDLGFVPIVLLTARADVEDRVAGLESGADAYLAKPFDPRELRATVASLLASRRAWRERHAAAVTPVIDAFPGVVSADEDLRARIEAAIHEHFADPAFSARDLAEAVGLSGSQLRRRTHELLSATPTEAIRAYRLAQGALLLRKESGTVAEVAYAVGFNSVSYFTRSFGDAYGRTPTAYIAEGKEIG